MAEQHPNVVVLVVVPTDLEAAMLRDALKQHDIDAAVEGELTSSFRAEVPGGVRLLVREDDLPRAREILTEFEHGKKDIDWSQIDVGDEP